MTSITTTPIDGQKPGTSGLRKKTRIFMGTHYLENFIQSIFNAIGGAQGKTFVLGGDGRFFNQDAAQVILKMAAANGAHKVIIGRDALLSTPAASHLIRKFQTDGGIIMSASHNPGGIDEDFGVKFNGPNGGPAQEALTDKIYAETKTLAQYAKLDVGDVDLSQIGHAQLGDMHVEVVDPVADYADYMAELFDFDAIKSLFGNGFTMRFDALCAITGPYAQEILERRLGAASGTVVNATPLPDFGGMHPDPNPTWAHVLWDELMGDDAPDFGAASDGDGDRNMILGRGAYVVPSDSLAIMAEHATKVKGYAGGLKGVARSMPTGAAVDHVAKALGIECHETPTGWKFFGNLLDAGRATLCGEESFGTGSDHVREKDGLWAVLYWLNILAVTGQSVSELLRAHWARFGRTYFSRHDFEALEVGAANDMLANFKAKQAKLAGKKVAGLTIKGSDEFSYDDPVDGSHSSAQGLRVFFEGGSRFVARLSGTGTEGATLRLYVEKYDAQSLDEDTQTAIKPIVSAALELLEIETYCGRSRADVVT